MTKDCPVWPRRFTGRPPIKGKTAGQERPSLHEGKLSPAKMSNFEAFQYYEEEEEELQQCLAGWRAGGRFGASPPWSGASLRLKFNGDTLAPQDEVEVLGVTYDDRRLTFITHIERLARVA
ncbi:hypothetical protein GWK47_040461 [Chionoecetes opilio]|uniref:Uncharacterized protein n=1 Tax=Chionoecetes opilio TaxID=41210 RepID=A0A8J4YJS1_CHIOP|nr:hypothetical protein GWK47_040461 [Chionoecetes opilio]